MSKTLTIQLSDELEEKLLIQSKKLNLSLEELILQSLAKSTKLIDSRTYALTGSTKYEVWVSGILT
ncbi:MAG: hypothetical protein ACLBM6_03750 [Cuspidothrix sp.]|jgi:predicted transcriptional regulator